jgi:alkaline phosphatase D
MYLFSIPSLLLISSIFIVSNLFFIPAKASEAPEAVEQTQKTNHKSLTNTKTPSSTRIAFLSCIDQEYQQPLWKNLYAANATAVLLIGDNVYANSGDPDILKRNYDALNAQPFFKMIRKETLVTGTWDDHDYGLNDGGREFKGKKAAQSAFLDFFEVPQDSARRQQEGIYHSVMLGEEGKRIQIILLDTRYFRSPLNKNSWIWYYLDRYDPSESEEQDMLGETQWAWLKQELLKPAEFRIIASSIQFASNNHGFERWEELPKEQARMIQLIKDTQAKGILFISGDRHLSELMKISPKESGLSYPLYDLTSSSFNHSLTNYFLPNTPRQEGDTIFTDNFGIIDIQWLDEPIITLKLQGADPKPYLEKIIYLKDLQ